MKIIIKMNQTNQLIPKGGFANAFHDAFNQEKALVQQRTADSTGAVSPPAHSQTPNDKELEGAWPAARPAITGKLRFT